MKENPSFYLEEAVINLISAGRTIPEQYFNDLDQHINFCLCNEASVCQCAENMHRRMYGQFDAEVHEIAKLKRVYIL
jgi:hypothetical protein